MVASAIPSSPKDAWKVLVVEKATGISIPGAEVLVLDLELTDSRGKLIPSARILRADDHSVVGDCYPKNPTLLLRLDPPEYLIEAPGYRSKTIRVTKSHMKMVLGK